MMASYGGGELQIRYYPVNNAESTHFKEYRSISELNEEWEDYEEPKEHYFITEYGQVFSLNEYEGFNNVANPEDYKAIGNYFDSEEEAEKAVEKLKAWKRLKDKGFKFEGVRTIGKVIDFDMPVGYYRAYCDTNFSNEKSLELFNDLNLIFGSEE